MKLAVIGSRKIVDKDFIYEVIDNYIKENCANESVVIISGGAEGVDSISKAYARDVGLDHIMLLPYFKVDTKAEFSARHFFARNRQIVSNADAVLAIWDGESGGTGYTIKYAEKKEKPLTVVTVNTINE